MKKTTLPDYGVNHEAYKSVPRETLVEMTDVSFRLAAALDHALTRKHGYNPHCQSCQLVIKAQADFKRVRRKVFENDRPKTNP